MSEVTALRKFHCPACGGDAEWNPAKNALVCPFCGAVTPVEVKPEEKAEIKENDLLQALQAVPNDERGWEAEKKTVRCQNCNAISVFDANRVSQRCDFCGSPALIAVEDSKAPIRPAALLPFKVPDTKVRDDLRKWYGRHWFAPNKLKSKALTDTLKGIYLPYWTFDAQSDAQWQAEAGYEYTVENDRGERETRIRWEYASGRLNHFFDDVLIPASQGVRPDLLRKLEPFPTTSDLAPYDPSYLSGWVAEQYQIDLLAASQLSRQRMDNDIRNMCISKIPGNTYRNLQVNAQYSEQTFKHILLPIWLATYTYGAKTFQVAVNGYTGKIAGKYPLSWVKVTIAVVIGLLLILLWMKLSHGHSHHVYYGH